ncbi:hypothetical protein SSX86_010457 [Deinandra increscens subsp. villosa]|uniref:No apical meristem-associated C-terminal domain-containing protein n=1 Tax=Deinandra increscens subsp. villosa TaxID=3103831 RepID=A0AAP0DFA8_9ASTR
MNLYNQGFSHFAQPQFGGYQSQPFQTSPTPRPSPPSQQTPSPRPTPPFQTSSTPRPSQPFSLQDDDVEIVNETQEVGGSQPKAKAKGKAKRCHKKKEVETRTPKEIQFWTEDENFALCRAYVEASKNPTKGNYQDMKEFWDEIRSKFFMLMGKGEYRNPDSGANDYDIYDRANSEFQAERGHFGLMKCWRFLYQSEKWKSKADITSRQTRRSKKSKTSSSADPESFDSTARTFNINLNDSGEDDEPDASTQPEMCSDRPRRGRDYARANHGKAQLSDYQAVVAESIQEIARS